MANKWWNLDSHSDFSDSRVIKHCATLSYIKPIIIFQLYLSPASTNFQLCDSSRLLNIKHQFPHLKMRTIIVLTPLGCVYHGNYSDREPNKACGFQKGNCNFPKDWEGLLKEKWHMIRESKGETEPEISMSFLCLL